MVDPRSALYACEDVVSTRTGVASGIEFVEVSLIPVAVKSVVKRGPGRLAERQNREIFLGKSGAGDVTRTRDLLITNGQRLAESPRNLGNSRSLTATDRKARQRDAS
jgi:hypothetical protein